MIKEENWKAAADTLLEYPDIMWSHYSDIKDHVPDDFYKKVESYPQEKFDKAFSAVVEFPESAFTPKMVEKIRVTQVNYPDFAARTLPPKYINPEIAHELLLAKKGKQDKLILCLLINSRQDLITDVIEKIPSPNDRLDFVNKIYRTIAGANNPSNMVNDSLFAIILNSGEIGILSQQIATPKFIEYWSKGDVNPKVIGDVFKNVPNIISDQVVKNLESAGYEQYIPNQYRNTVSEELARIKKLSGLM